MNITLSSHLIFTPLGEIELIGKGECLCHLSFLSTSSRRFIEETDRETSPPFFLGTKAWLEAYFAHRPLPPLPPLCLQGTEFQKAVWQEAMDIALGHTLTYADLAQRVAHRLGRARPAVRAVGQALGVNPILILVPCHRIVSANGGIGGFSAGLWLKQALLRHEGWGKI